MGGSGGWQTHGMHQVQSFMIGSYRPEADLGRQIARRITASPKLPLILYSGLCATRGRMCSAHAHITYSAMVEAADNVVQIFPKKKHARSGFCIVRKLDQADQRHDRPQQRTADRKGGAEKELFDAVRSSHNL